MRLDPLDPDWSKSVEARFDIFSLNAPSEQGHIVDVANPAGCQTGELKQIRPQFETLGGRWLQPTYPHRSCTQYHAVVSVRQASIYDTESSQERVPNADISRNHSTASKIYPRGLDNTSLKYSSNIESKRSGRHKSNDALHRSDHNMLTIRRLCRQMK